MYYPNSRNSSTESWHLRKRNLRINFDPVHDHEIMVRGKNLVLINNLPFRVIGFYFWLVTYVTYNTVGWINYDLPFVVNSPNSIVHTLRMHPTVSYTIKESFPQLSYTLENPSNVENWGLQYISPFRRKTVPTAQTGRSYLFLKHNSPFSTKMIGLHPQDRDK